MKSSFAKPLARRQLSRRGTGLRSAGVARACCAVIPHVAAHVWDGCCCINGHLATGRDGESTRYNLILAPDGQTWSCAWKMHVKHSVIRAIKEIA